jgi:type I restriction enzyme S subunit
VPPLDEQSAITAEVRARRKRIDQVQAAATREILLMREYRSRLVSDVATGKLDVREAAAALPARGLREDLDDLAETSRPDDAGREEELAEVEA